MDGRIKISLGGGAKKSVTTATSNGSGSNPSKLAPRRSLFDGDDDGHEAERVSAASTSKWPGVSGAAPMSRAARQRQEAALALDATVNDYDGVYDAMKSGEREAQRRRDDEKRARDPKYMAASLAASEQRKLDRQRAEAKKIQRERDEEGDAFQHTEAFVTEAYKEQMESMREAEEKDRAEEQHDRQYSRGVAGFYKDMLAEQEKTHSAAVSAAAASNSGAKVSASVSQHLDSTEQRRQLRVEEARRRGLDVRLNDDNEVVDERSLLSAGLNTLSKRKRVGIEATATDGSSPSRPPRPGTGREHDGARAAREARDAQRQRQSQQIQEQMLAAQEQREEEHRAQEQARREALVGQRRNDDRRIAEARQRALERRQLQHQRQQQHEAG